uniref:Uncharacterized protein n=1 Tax=viral metagenome TaxID=1070528 RepID=A0A6C0LM65_9ZZZZ
MNGAAPPPGIPAQRLGPLPLNLKNEMLRINTNKRLAALNSIGVSPPEKNLPRLSNLAPFPVPEPVLAQPSRLSAKSSNWSPPLPPGPPPRPAPANNNYSRFYNAAYNVPDWQKPPPPMNRLLDHLRRGGRLYREQFSRDDWRRVWDFVELHRDAENIRFWSRDNITGEKLLHPYFYIPKSTVSKTRRKRKQSRGTRRHR